MGDEEGATGSSQSSLSFKEGQRGGGDGGGGLRSLISRSASHRSVSSVTDQEGGSEHGSQNGASTQNMARTLSSASIASTSSVVSRRSVTTGVLHINDYKRVALLGKGSYGDVYKVEDLRDPDHTCYALKVLDQKRSDSTAILREIAVLKKLRHRNLVRLHEVMNDPSDSKVYLVMELVEQGELIGDVLTCEPFKLDIARRYFRDVICGLACTFLHFSDQPTN